MKNQGISLISLIITIIVIIILAAIVIFTGLGTPDSAQFAAFTQQVDNVYMAVMNAHADLKVKHAISGDYRTDEQIYMQVATNSDPEQYAVMTGAAAPTTVATTLNLSSSAHVQRILPDAAKVTMKMTLPKIRQSNAQWYVTEDGRVFNSNGYEYDGKTYFSGSIYNKTVLPALSESSADVTKGMTRATNIWNVISGDTNVTAFSD